MKRAGRVESVKVQRKAAAACAFSGAATQLGGKRWEYVPVSHTDVQRTNNFQCVLAKRICLSCDEQDVGEAAVTVLTQSVAK
jgi:hypothetical protein